MIFAVTPKMEVCILQYSQKAVLYSPVQSWIVCFLGVQVCFLQNTDTLMDIGAFEFVCFVLSVAYILMMPWGFKVQTPRLI